MVHNRTRKIFAIENGTGTFWCYRGFSQQHPYVQYHQRRQFFVYNNQTPANFPVLKVFWILLVLNKLLHNACQTHDKMLHQSEPYRPCA